MTAPLLQLTSVTKSFGAVRVLNGVAFDLRTDTPGQPGGLPDGSRRSQRSADLRSTPRTRPHPNGVPDRPKATSVAIHTTAIWHPSGMRSLSSPVTGGLHSIPTSGYPLPTLRVVHPRNETNSVSHCAGRTDSARAPSIGKSLIAPFRSLTAIPSCSATVRALKSISLDPRRTAPGQPGGLPDGSRRSQRSADLRSTSPPRRHPGGVPDHTYTTSATTHPTAFWHPSGMRPISSPATGGLHFIPTSGYPLPTLRVARRTMDASVAKRFR
jgi:hypothetical protein